MDGQTKAVFDDMFFRLQINKKILKEQKKEAEKFQNTFLHTAQTVSTLLLQLQETNNQLLKMQNQVLNFQQFINNQQVHIKSLHKQINYLSYVEQENSVLREYILRINPKQQYSHHPHDHKKDLQRSISVSGGLTNEKKNVGNISPKNSSSKNTSSSNKDNLNLNLSLFSSTPINTVVKDVRFKNDN